MYGGLVQLCHKWACALQFTTILTTVFISLSGPGLRCLWTECEEETYKEMDSS